MIGRGDRARASVFRRLAVLERAGLPIATGVRRVIDGGGAGRLLVPVLRSLEDGAGVGEAFAKASAFSAFETRVIESGVRAGTLPESFEQLAVLHEERARLSWRLVAGLSYPLLLLHGAVFLPQLGTLVESGLRPYLAKTLLPLLVAYGVVAGAVLLYRMLRATQAGATDRVLLALPWVGGLVLKRSLIPALRALSILYQNGVPITQAIAAAAEVSPNSALGAAFARVEARVLDGEELPAAFASEPLFPGVVLEMIATGASSGQLDEMLRRAIEVVEAEAKQGQTVALAVVTGGAFLVAAGFVGYAVISFYAGYFARLPF